MINEEHIDKIFREKLESFSEEPPLYIWQGVRENLKPEAKKRILTWYYWSAVAAVLALAFVAGWYFREEMSTPRHPIVKNETPVEKKDPVLHENITTPLLADEKRADISPTRPAIHFPEPVLNRVERPSLPDDNIFLSENRMIKHSVPPDMSFMDRIEAFPVRHPDPVSSITVREMKKDGLASNPAFRERDLIDVNREELALVQSERRKWKMGLSVSPGYSSYRASHGSLYASNMALNSSEGNSNISGGIAVQFKTRGKWSFESGVYYAQNGQQTSSSAQLFGSRKESYYKESPPVDQFYFNTAVTINDNNLTMNSTAGVIVLDNLPPGVELNASPETYAVNSNSILMQGEVSQVFDFVEIPLYVRYLLFESKVDVELVGGISAGVLSGNDVFIKNENGLQNIGKTRDISSVNVSGTIG
ncbi:MAG: hypothetical protein PHV35_12185, partial [Mariniphaga sp.]|nr:hypothetical protein [Mariniphaga sp.]